MNVSFEEVTTALKQTFPKVFDVKPVKGKLSEEKRALAKRLRREKYSTNNWIFKRPNATKEPRK